MQKLLEKQRQEQVFVAKVGRRPHPRGANRGDPDLHIAARLNLPVLVRSLLNQGADIHASGNEGETPLHVATAVNASAVANVLLKAGADTTAKDNRNETPLHAAAAMAASRVANVLLEAGTNIPRQRQRGRDTAAPNGD